MNEEELKLIEFEIYNMYNAVKVLKKAVSFDESENGRNTEYLFLIDTIENSLKKISSHF